MCPVDHWLGGKFFLQRHHINKQSLYFLFFNLLIYLFIFTFFTLLLANSMCFTGAFSFVALGSQCFCSINSHDSPHSGIPFFYLLFYSSKINLKNKIPLLPTFLTALAEKKRVGRARTYRGRWTNHISSCIFFCNQYSISSIIDVQTALY